MKKIVKITLLIILAGLLSNCNEDELATRDYPRLKTLPVTNIDKDGATFNAKFLIRGNFEIKQYGFVWDEHQYPELGRSEQIINTDNIHSESFSSTASTTLLEDSVYFVRAFVQTEDYTVYGENSSFTSLGSKAPEIISFKPTSGTKGDTINIKGHNFSYRKNEVYFDESTAKVISSSDTLLTVVVPDEIQNSENKIKITISGNTARADEEFILLRPELENILPRYAKSNEELIISGKNFGNQNKHIKVFFNNELVEVLENKKTKLKVIVPERLTENTKLKVQVGNLFDSMNITYLKPKLKNVDNDLVSWGDEVNLFLQNGHKDTTLFNLFLDEKIIQINHASDSVINFFIPQDIASANPKLSLKIAGFDLQLQKPLTLRPLKISSISPDSIGLNEEVSVVVDNLHPDQNKVLINNLEVESTLSPDLKTIRFKMPTKSENYINNIENKKVGISILANNTLSKDTLLLFKTPQISSINKKIVAIGEEVIIQGVNFNPLYQKVRIMGENVQIENKNNSEIRFNLPDIPEAYEARDSLNQIRLEILLNEGIKIDTSLIVKAPVVTEISPSSLNSVDDVITITGKNFGSNPEIEFAEEGGLFYNAETRFELDNSVIEIISSSDEEIQFRIQNLILQNDKITQYLSSKINVKSFGLHTITEDSIIYEFRTNWKYIKVNPNHSINKKRRLFIQNSEFGFIIGGYKPFGNTIDGIRTVFQLDNRTNGFTEIKTWNNTYANDFYKITVPYAFIYQGFLYGQRTRGNIRKYEITDEVNKDRGWADATELDDIRFGIEAQFEYSNDLFFLSFGKMIKLSNGDSVHLSTLDEQYRFKFSKKVNDDFFLVIENLIPYTTTYELHRYNITNDFWEKLNGNYLLPDAKASRNPALVDYLFDENYVYDFDFVTGDKTIRFEFPENFTSLDDIELLFKLGNTWYFNIKNDQYLIYVEN